MHQNVAVSTRPRRSARRVWVVIGLTVCWLSGCTPSGQPAALDAGARFQAALARGDLSAACAWLSEPTRTRLEATREAACPEALAGLALPVGPVASIEVWGGNAQARLEQGVVFLGEFAVGWRVVAAGCQARPERPYDCAVQS